MNHDWKLFGKEVHAPSGKAPAHLADSIVGRVRADLDPPIPQLLAKLGIIHALVSIGTLSICPQFGFRLFGEGMGLMHSFMALGTFGCPLACGMFFLGSSLSLSGALLTRPEWRAVRRHRVLTLTALVLPSLGFFRIMDGDFFLEFSIAWLVGALLAGALMVEGIWRLKAVRVSAV